MSVLVGVRAAAAPITVPELAIPASGWTLPAAVRYVALSNPTSALPPGVSLQALASLSPTSPVWTTAARSLSSQATLTAAAPEMVRASLQAVGIAAARGLSYALKDANQGELTDERLAELAEFAVVMPEKARPALLVALNRGDAAAARSRALARMSAEALSGEPVVAASDADPALLIVQYGLQEHKNLIRSLRFVEKVLAPGGGVYYSTPSRLPRLEPYSRAVVPRAETIAPLLEAENPLTAMIADARQRDGRVVWADAGGGLGVPQRQWSHEGLGADVDRVLVDLFDWEKLSRNRLVEAIDYYDNIGSGRIGSALFSEQHRPRVLLADVASVQFPEDARPNLITSIESVHYWPDKIGVLVNLYNQLQDGGLLVVAAQYPWGRLIRAEGTVAPRIPFRLVTPLGTLQLSRNRTPPPAASVRKNLSLFDDFVAALSAAGVELAAIVPPGDFVTEDARSLVIRRKPGTRLIQNATLDRVVRQPDGFSESRYASLPEGRPPVEVAH